MREQEKKTDIFKWIETKFKTLSISEIDKDQRLQQLKNSVASQMKEII